jgi:hypothetical protein
VYGVQALWYGSRPCGMGPRPCGMGPGPVVWGPGPVVWVQALCMESRPCGMGPAPVVWVPGPVVWVQALWYGVQALWYGSRPCVWSPGPVVWVQALWSNYPRLQWCKCKKMMQNTVLMKCGLKELKCSPCGLWILSDLKMDCNEKNIYIVLCYFFLLCWKIQWFLYDFDVCVDNCLYHFDLHCKWKLRTFNQIDYM